MVLKRIDLVATQGTINTFVQAQKLLQGNKNVKIVKMDFTVSPNVTALVAEDGFYVQITKSSQSAILSQVSNQVVYKWSYVQIGSPVGNTKFQVEVKDLPAYRCEGIFLGFNTASRAATSLDSVECTIYYNEYEGGY
jgi:hypothetical protein